MIDAERVLETRTHGDAAHAALVRLAEALRLPAGSANTLHLGWRRFVGSFADERIPSMAPWYSGISDDSSPYEFSLVLDPDAPELRVLWESQGASGDPRAKRNAAMQTHARLCRDTGLRSERFAAIADLFLPPAPQGTFVLWHAARLWPTGQPELKAYLNPQVRGSAKSATLVQQALGRLGLSDAWPFVTRAMSRGPALDEVRYFSLDMSDDDTARIKVYVYHHDPTPEVLANAAATSPFAAPDRVVSFFDRISAGRPAAPGFAPATCLSFVQGRGSAPVAATLHVPIRAYVRDDLEACDRIAALAGAGPHARAGEMRLLDAPSAAQHRRVAMAISCRPLESGVGLTSYVSLRSQHDGERVTCYLSTELFAVQPPRGR